MFDKSHRIIYKYANSWDLDSKSIEDYVKQNFWEELKKEGFPKKLSNCLFPVQSSPSKAEWEAFVI